MSDGRIGLGVVGMGRGFVLTLPTLRAMPGIALRAAFDLRAPARAAFEATFGAKAYDTLDALLADPAVDAVYIATPHGFHAAQAIAALRAGKHVLVEKPMAIGLNEAAAMVAAAREAGRALMVGPSHGYDAPVLQAARMIASGDHGAVRHVTALNYTDFLYRPRRVEELDEAQGGGVVYGQASHQIDVVRRLVGAPVATVRAVTGQWDAARPVAGAYAALMTFANGASASLTYSGYAHYDSDALVGWISELGHPKNPAGHGDARRRLAALPPGGEDAARQARTFGADGTGAVAAPAPHHEHFGFVLVSCDHADLKVTPTAIEIYADRERHDVPVAGSPVPRAAVLDRFVDAIAGRTLEDGSWGWDTLAACAAMIESSRTAADATPALLDPMIGDTTP